MRPKYVLWIAVSVVSSSWYVLDPAARPVSGTHAKAPSVETQPMVRDPVRETAPRTAML